MGPSYQYRAAIIRVVDGDTVWAEVDCGFDLSLRMSLRLAGINAPETSTDAGKAARAYLTGRLPVGTAVVVQTTRDKTEKYGRMLATVWLGDVDINQEMIDTGHAVAWDGKGPRP